MIIFESNKTFTLTADMIDLSCCGFIQTSKDATTYFLGLSDGSAINVIKTGEYCRTALVKGVLVDGMIVSLIFDAIPDRDEWAVITDCIKRIDDAKGAGDVIQANMAGQLDIKNSYSFKNTNKKNKYSFRCLEIFGNYTAMKLIKYML